MEVINSVEHSENELLPTANRHIKDRNAAPLPWGTPGAFDTAPTYLGRLWNRDQQAFKATNDLDVVGIWLAERAGGNQNTAVAYRKEVERLLLWLADQDLSLSDASREDYIRYARFVKDPSPASKWISKKRRRRDHPDWRPFSSPLSDQAAKQALTICRSLISYLHTNGWLTANTMPSANTLVRHTPLPRSEQIALRQVPEHLMQEIEDHIPAFAGKAKRRTNEDDECYEKRKQIIRSRLEVCVSLMGTMGARSSDLVGASLANMVIRTTRPGETHWAWLMPAGKGNKDRSLPLPHRVVSRIKVYRTLVGLTVTPAHGEQSLPLIPSLSGLPKKLDSINKWEPKPLTRSGLHRELKKLLKSVSVKLMREGRIDEGRLLESCSGHWFRHTAGKRILEASGNNLTVTRRLLNHASIQTTADYVDATTRELLSALNSTED